MNKYLFHALLGILIVFLITSCGKKKNPFLLLLNESTNTSQTMPAKGDIPLIYEQGNTSTNQNNNSNASSNSSSENSTSINESLSGIVTVNDQTGQLEFNFNTTINVNFQITVLDPSGAVENATVNITDPSNGNTIIFQGITNQNGIIEGIITIPSALENVDINVIIGQYSATQTVQLQRNGEYTILINRQIVFNQEVEQHINQITDNDKDGIADEFDSYPDDATRSTRTILPNSGVSIVAYEDLYPNKGDADFNDVVLQVTNEEDLNADGKVVRIRGKYKLLAKGAGYSHVIFLNLPGKGNYHVKVYNESNNVVSEVSLHLNSLQQLPIFIRNDRFFTERNINNSTLYFTNQLCSGMCNVYQNRPITPSYSAEIEIIFDEPLNKSQLTSAPYDLYVYVNNTRKEIHLPGLFKNNQGKDLYLDSDGFPWAIVIPVEWNWPLERKKIHDAYPFFENWYLSEGNDYKDWYKRFDDNAKLHQFLYFNISPITAYFLQFGSLQQSLLWTFLAIFISGILVFLFIKGRTKYHI